MSFSHDINEDSSQFCVVHQEVIGPFEEQGLAWHRDINGFGERQAGNQRQRLRRRVAVTQFDQSAAGEIARFIDPAAPLAALARKLAQSDQPVSLDRLAIADQPVVGRADLLDDPDSGQNSEPAALLVIRPSGPMSK